MGKSLILDSPILTICFSGFYVMGEFSYDKARLVNVKSSKFNPESPDTTHTIHHTPHTVNPDQLVETSRPGAD